MYIVVCDDDPKVLKYLCAVLHTEFHNTCTVSGAASFSEIQTLLETTVPQIDVLIMDILLREENGIDVAYYLTQRFPNMKTIFITGYNEYVEEIFLRVKPYAYLAKPVCNERLFTHIRSILSERENGGGLQFSFNRVDCFVPFRSICYIERQKRKSIIFTAEKPYESYDTFSALLKALPPHFVQCHQSYIVNLQMVKTYQPKTFVLLDGTKILISRTHERESREKWLLFRGGML
ncbi:MAG: LytR/AlgR family response regulator transcription factor [Candidatus Fimenecus sp.]